MASHLELVRVASPPSIPLEMTADMRQFVGKMSIRKRGKSMSWDEEIELIKKWVKEREDFINE